ncbi:hypothetical protein BC830DRAFT_1153532 [Chytriomyces sp. MP71]|nr:hypothetical protein BC830DRAFT_1153532 [Chytriomyces sp. MP71]
MFCCFLTKFIQKLKKLGSNIESAVIGSDFTRSYTVQHFLDLNCELHLHFISVVALILHHLVQ